VSPSWRPSPTDVLDICRVILSFAKSGVQQGSPNRVFRFLKVPRQALFGAFSEEFVSESSDFPEKGLKSVDASKAS